MGLIKLRWGLRLMVFICPYAATNPNRSLSITPFNIKVMQTPQAKQFIKHHWFARQEVEVQ